jgi:cytochrome P450
MQGVQDSASQSPPRILGGVESWRWYWHYLRDPLECFAEGQRRFGAVCALGSPLPFWFGGRNYVFAIGAAYNRQVLGQPDLFRPGGQVMVGPKGSAHQRIRRGIFAMHDEKHRAHRQLMQPPFLKSAVATYAGIMARLIDQVVDQWQSGAPLDMYRQMRTLSNWVASHILFGNEDFAASVQLGKTIERWLVLDARNRNTFFWLNVPGTAYRQLLKQAELLEKDMRAAIERNRRTKTPGSDVLSILIQAANRAEAEMTETDLVAHAVILYAASFETTANVLAWTMFLIAQHPSIAAGLHDEIREKFNDWPPDPNRLDALTLLDGVVRESLRLMPPVAYTFRTARREVELGGLPLRRGDRVILSHYLTHRDPHVFPQPNRFDPSRWLTLRPEPYQYIPFSAGPRLCLGHLFAMLELKLTVARVMQRFRMNVIPGSRIDGAIQLTLRPRQGIPMTVRPQDRAFAASPVTGNIHRMIDLPV